jgi:hypothetical protein
MTTLPRLPDRLCRDLAAPRTIVYDNGRGRIRGFGLRLPDQADLRIQLHQQRRLQTPAGFWRRHQARVPMVRCGLSAGGKEIRTAGPSPTNESSSWAGAGPPQ